MKQQDVPIYNDPDHFEVLGDNAKYPCSTQFMEYRAIMKKYYLTNEALEHNGIAIDNNNSTQFIEEVTEDLYGVMLNLAPFNYEYNGFLIAQSLSRAFTNKYACRKQFEKALIYQAQYKVMNIDPRMISGVNIDGNSNIDNKQLRREHRHISPKSLDILQGLGLLFNGNIPSKVLINYKELM